MSNEQQTLIQEYANLCSKIGEHTIIILNAEISIAELQRSAKQKLEEIHELQKK